MSLHSQSAGYALLFSYAAFMVGITFLFARWRTWKSIEGFLVAGRNVPWWLNGPSIAASWIFAGALFVSVQMAYEKGLAGIFWFTFPNVIALGLFAIVGTKIRERFHSGFTLPEFILRTLDSRRVHKLILIPFFFGQLVAVAFNVVAGGAIVSFLTGIPLTTVMIILIIITLTYTMISGLEASIVTDFVQLVFIILGITIIVPWAIFSAGGPSAVATGLSGLHGTRDIFDPAIAFSFGLVSSIGLISQTLTDQQYWQRVFASKSKDLKRAFLFGAILFAIVPLGLSSLGFLAANQDLGIALPPETDMALIGIITIKNLIHVSVAAVYMVIMLSGLTSTIDSAMAATASLWVTDGAPYFTKKSMTGDPKIAIRQARFAMIGISMAGLALAYLAHSVAGFGLKQLFLISISVAASTSVPVLFVLYYNKVSERGVFWGVLLSLLIGMPLFIYANYINNEILIALASLSMITISGSFCYLARRK